MLQGLIWWRDGSHVSLTGPHRNPEGAVRLGVSLLVGEHEEAYRRGGPGRVRSRGEET